MNTCFDCKQRFDRDSMHLIKAPTLNGRALICDDCHQSEVASIREFNRSIARPATTQGGENRG